MDTIGFMALAPKASSASTTSPVVQRKLASVPVRHPLLTVLPPSATYAADVTARANYVDSNTTTAGAEVVFTDGQVSATSRSRR